jgi:hypothetical protein
LRLCATRVWPHKGLRNGNPMVRFSWSNVLTENFAALALLLPTLTVLSAGARLLRAQTKAPELHRRGYNQADDDMDSGTRSSGRTILPAEASGEYTLGSGEMVDVELQPDRLSGFITRLGDRESDEGTPLTFFFATSRLAPQQLAFTTKQIHGVWFSFEGTIVRGPARSRDQQGYYLLEGRLVLHDVAGKTDQARMVSLPLARQYPNGG